MKYLSRLYCVLLLLAIAAPRICAYDYRDAAGIYYNISGSRATVTHGDSYGSYSGNVEIPATISVNGSTVSVVAIGESAFRGSAALTSVTVGANVTTIGDYAFLRCPALTSVTFDNDAPLEVGVSAFRDCTALSEVRWLSCEPLDGRGGLTSLETGAFAGCSSLTHILLPGGITYLGSGIFDGCDALATVTLMNTTPVKVKSAPLGVDAAQVTLQVPLGTAGAYSTAVGWRDYNISELSYSLKDDNGYLYRITGANTLELLGHDGASEKIDVRAQLCDYEGNRYIVTSIAPRAFAGANIKELNLTKAFYLKTIGDEAFANCDKLHSVTLTEGLTTLGEGAFAGCEVLQQVQLPSTLRTVSPRAFENCAALSNVKLIMGVGALSDNAFAGCSSLKTIFLPRSIMWVSSTAFAGCSAMTSYDVDAGSLYYTSIEGVLVELNNGEDYTNALIGNMGTIVAYPPQKAATEFYVPCGVHTIGENAFAGATHLRHLALPATVTTLGNNCFSGTALQSINLRGNTPITVRTNALSALSAQSLQLQVPVDAAAAYKASSSWRKFTNITERYDVFNDERYAYDWDAAGDVVLVDFKPAAVSAAGVVTMPLEVTISSVDYNIMGLASNATDQIATLTKTLNINSPHFAYILTDGDRNPLNALENLQQLSLSSDNPNFKLSPDGVLTNFKGNVLYYYPRYSTAQSYSLPATVDTIRPRAFAFNRDLSAVAFSSTLNSIGGGAFMSCPGLRAVTNAVSVIYIGDDAFSQCENLSLFTGGEKINTIGNRAFYHCKNLDYFPFYHGMLKSLGDEAFAGCEKIKVVVLSNILSSIGDNAFEGCEALERVYFTSNITDFGQEIFKGCPALRNLWLCNATPPAVTATFLERCGLSTGTLWVPEEAVDAYRKAPTWSRVPTVNASYVIYNGADINSDKVVNALDVTILYSAITGQEETDFVSHLDVNRDGAVNAADVTFIYAYILNGREINLTYKFVNEQGAVLAQSMKLGGNNQLVFAQEGNTDKFVTTGISADTDNAAVMNLIATSRDGRQCYELEPINTGYCSVVCKVTVGGVTYYRAFPLKVLP